jgi:DNA-binding Lrp family transcriptional regulator
LPAAVILDLVDYLIIQQLHRDSRMLASEVGKRIGIKERTIRKRIDKMRESEIGRFTFIVNPLTFGYGVNIDIFINVRSEHKSQVLKQLASLSNISFLGYDVGTNDISVEALFKNTDQLHVFLEHKLPKISGVEVTGYALVPLIIRNTDDWLPLSKDFAQKKGAYLQKSGMRPPREKTRIPQPQKATFKGFDNLDYELLVQLNKNSRAPASQIARKFGVNAGTIRNRIDRLILRGAGEFKLVLNPNFFGYGLKVDIFLEIVSGSSNKIVEHLLAIPQIAYLALGQGTNDISIELRVKSNEELNQFLFATIDSIPDIKLKSYTLIPTIQKSFDEWLPLPEDFIAPV